MCFMASRLHLMTVAIILQMPISVKGENCSYEGTMTGFLDYLATVAIMSPTKGK
jgi:hypothetical protein